MVNIRISLLLSFLATAFPWDKINNDTLEYSRVKCYSGILCALVELSKRHKKYQQFLNYLPYQNPRDRTEQLKLISPLFLHVNAQVWFWWIDETLSVNLVYQSDYEIGGTFQVMEQLMMIMMVVWPWWSSAWTWKRRKRKTKSSRQRWYLIRAFWFGDRDT